MLEFDIRVTGTLDVPAEEIVSAREKIAALIGDLYVGLVAEGSKVQHASLNSQPVDVSVAKPTPAPSHLVVDLDTKKHVEPAPTPVAPPDGHESA